jgi:hypothetical protein
MSAYSILVLVPLDAPPLADEPQRSALAVFVSQELRIQENSCNAIPKLALSIATVTKSSSATVTNYREWDTRQGAHTSLNLEEEEEVTARQEMLESACLFVAGGGPWDLRASICEQPTPRPSRSGDYVL